ncbi:MAG: head GIN domain-containing protein [Thermonemataceae bacterium]
MALKNFLFLALGLVIVVLTIIFVLPPSEKNALPNTSTTSTREASTSQREATDFQALVVKGAVDVVLQQDTLPGVQLEVKGMGTEKVKTYVKEGTLTIEVPSSSFSFFSGEQGSVTAYVSYTTLQRLEASGASSIEIKKLLKSPSLAMKLSGACELKGNIKTNRLILELSGASTSKLGGIATYQRLEASGASDLAHKELKSQTIEVDLSGASDATLWAEKSIEGEASGASDISVRGNPRRRSVETSGSSDIDYD